MADKVNSNTATILSKANDFLQRAGKSDKAGDSNGLIKVPTVKSGDNFSDEFRSLRASTLGTDSVNKAEFLVLCKTCDTADGKADGEIDLALALDKIFSNAEGEIAYAADYIGELKTEAQGINEEASQRLRAIMKATGYDDEEISEVERTNIETTKSARKSLHKLGIK